MGVFTSTQKSTDEAVTTLSQSVMTKTATTAGSATVTTAQCINAIWFQTDGGTPGTKTLPTAALLVAAIKGCVVGTTVRFIVHNNDAADTLTVAQGSGGTPYGTLTVAATKCREFIIHVTNITAAAEAYDLYGLATT